MEKIVVLDEIGEVSLRKSRKFKHLSIRMAPNKGIWINVPNGLSDKDAIQFALEKKDWILKSKKKTEAKEAKKTIFSSQSEFRTKYHQLRLVPASINEYTASLKDGFLEVIYPDKIGENSNELQQFIQKAVVETMRREAKFYLPQRLQHLAELHGFQYKSVTIRNTKSRWGSCSYDNRINLSLHLMCIPEELSDMVILHELCHTIEKNHSEKFWALLAKHCPNLELKKKQLKQYSLNIL